MYTLINGNLTEISKACISPASEGFLYGYGLFETIKVHNNQIFFFDEHLERLQEGCKVLDLPLDYDPGVIEDHCYELILANELTDGAVKIVYAKNKEKADLIITTRESGYTAEKYLRGFSLCLAKARKDPSSRLTYLKSNNYLENILARQQAAEQNFDEAIFLNTKDEICEGTFTNIFFVKDAVIYTPSVDCGLLEGILRNKLIDLIKELGLKLEIGVYCQETLAEAKEIFVTNSLMDIMPVNRLEDQSYDLDNNTMTRTLQKEFRKRYYTGYTEIQLEI